MRDSLTDAGWQDKDTSAQAGSSPSVELLLFDIGASTYAADASQVRRIDRPSDNAIVLRELGTPLQRARALVFDTADGEAQLVVDRVRGVQNALLEHLRRMPAVARCHAFALGMYLGAETPILLIDLPETARVSAL